MKTIICGITSYISFYIFLIVSFCAMTGCSRVNAEAMSKVRSGMSIDQVTSLLGPPAHILETDSTVTTGKVYIYPSDRGEGHVIFVNDTVFKADFTPGIKGL
jgi:hypothetical protein